MGVHIWMCGSTSVKYIIYMYLDVHVCIYVKEHVGLHSWMCELYICMWVCIFGCVEVHLCIVHMYVGVYVQVWGGGCGHALLDVCKCVWECVGGW